MMKQLLYLAIFLLISSDTVLATDPKYTVLSDEFTVNYFWGVGNPLSKRRVSCPEYHSDDIEKIINKKPDVLPQFLRTSKNLNKKQWGEVNKFVSQIKKNKGNS